MPRYLLFFRHCHLSFRWAEFDSILSLHGVERSTVYSPSSDSGGVFDDGGDCGGELLKTPCHVVTFESDEVAKMVVGRCVLIHRCMRLWGSGTTADEVSSVLGVIEGRRRYRLSVIILTSAPIRCRPPHQYPTLKLGAMKSAAPPPLSRSSTKRLVGRRPPWLSRTR